MTGFDAARLLAALIEAVNGRRALFHLGWSGVDPKALPDNVLAIGDTPHDWLFPRTAAVIHHGGSGTSHSAARAGVPSIVMPLAGDQFFWAERLRLAGVAPAALDGQRPKAEAFARALDFVAGAQIRDRGKLLGETMRAEDGVTAALAAPQRIVANSRSKTASACRQPNSLNLRRPQRRGDWPFLSRRPIPSPSRTGDPEDGPSPRRGEMELLTSAQLA